MSKSKSKSVSMADVSGSLCVLNARACARDVLNYMCGAINSNESLSHEQAFAAKVSVEDLCRKMIEDSYKIAKMGVDAASNYIQHCMNMSDMAYLLCEKAFQSNNRPHQGPCDWSYQGPF